ncbi:MAG: sensor histidine kinase [Candidatus Caldatribacteriaceae bacterium]
MIHLLTELFARWRIQSKENPPRSLSLDDGGSLYQNLLSLLEKMEIPAFSYSPSRQLFAANALFFNIAGIPFSFSPRWVYEFPFLGEIVSGRVKTIHFLEREYEIKIVNNGETVFFLFRERDEIPELLEELQFFLTALGHELKTPLTVIKGYAEVLRGETPHVQVETVIRLQKQIGRLEETIRNLWGLSFLGVTGSLSWKEVSEVVTLVVENWQEEIRNKNLLWRWTMVPQEASLDLPLSRGDFFLLFSNLFSNAVKFSASQGEVQGSLVLRERKVFLELRNFVPENVTSHEILKKWESFRNLRRLPEKSVGVYLIEKTLERIGGKLEILFGSRGEIVFRVSLSFKDETGYPS